MKLNLITIDKKQLCYCFLCNCLIIFLILKTNLLAQIDSIKSIAPKIIVRQNTPLYTSSSLDSKQSNNLGIFSILFLIDQKKNMQSDRFYLVGDNKSNPLGWILADQAIKWNHRLLFKHIKKEKSTRIYLFKDFEPAKKTVLHEHQSHELEGVIELSAFLENYPDVFFPIIEQKEIQNALEKKNLIKVGLLSAANAGGGYSTDIDFLFILNLSKGFKNYIPTIRDIIQSTINTNNQNKKLALRFGIMCYQKLDKQAKEPYIYKDILPLNDADDETLNLLKSKINLDDTMVVNRSKDLEYILLNGIEQTKWSFNGLRTIIFIEHAGSYTDRGKTTGEAYGNVLEKASENQVRFITVTLESNRKEVNQAHAKQLQFLAAGKSSNSSGKFIAANSREHIKQQLIVALNNELELANRYKTIIKRSSDAENNIAQNFLNSDKAWISVGDSSQQSYFAPHVFVSRDELALYLFNLRTFITLHSNSLDIINKVREQTLSLLIGENLSKDKKAVDISEIIKILPYRSEILTYQDVNALTDDNKNNILQSINQKTTELQSHLENPKSWNQVGKEKMQYTLIPLSLIP